MIFSRRDPAATSGSGSTAVAIRPASKPPPLRTPLAPSSLSRIPQPYRSTPDDTSRWLHNDHLGTTRLATNTIGTQTSRHTYTTSGIPQVDTTGTAPRLLLGYAGEQHDPETGLTYLRARYMDPTTGQFLTVDPLNASTGQPHSYAGANPVHNTDPTGMYCLVYNDEGGCVGAGVIDNTGRWIDDHGATAVTATSVGVCIVATFGTCAGFTAAAFAARTANTLHDNDGRFFGEGGTARGIFIDALFTGVGVGTGALMEFTGGGAQSLSPSQKALALKLWPEWLVNMAHTRPGIIMSAFDMSALFYDCYDELEALRFG